MKVTENVLNSKSDPMNKMLPSELSYPSKTTNSTQIGKCGKTQSKKNHVVVQLVYTSQKSRGQFKQKEHKPPIVNQQNFVYYYKCGLCDTEYVGFTSRHLHQRVEEHERSTIGNHVKDEHGKDAKETTGSNFRFRTMSE